MEKRVKKEPTPPWKKKRKRAAASKPLTPQQKAMAKVRAEEAGRRYPNLIDNMWAAGQDLP